MPSVASRPAPVELLAAFDGAMQAGGWSWYVFGAQAVVAYGRPRMTGDVDVTVELGTTPPGELVRVLLAHGFATRFDLSADFLATAHLVPMTHAATHMPVDVVIARPGLQSDFLKRCRRVDIGGHTVPLISVEDLVVTKVLAGRRKDLEDIRGVLLTRVALKGFTLPPRGCRSAWGRAQGFCRPAWPAPRPRLH
jgi:hypothetical protein